MDIAALAARFEEHSGVAIGAIERVAQKATAVEAKAAAIESKTDGLVAEIANLHQRAVRGGSGGTLATKAGASSSSRARVCASSTPTPPGRGAIGST